MQIRQAARDNVDHDESDALMKIAGALCSKRASKLWPVLISRTYQFHRSHQIGPALRINYLHFEAVRENGRHDHWRRWRRPDTGRQRGDLSAAFAPVETVLIERRHTHFNPAAD